MKEIPRERVFSFDRAAEQQLVELLGRTDANERDDILPFFRQQPLPLIVAAGALSDFARVYYEPSLGRVFRADFVSMTFCSMGGSCFFYELEQHNFPFFTKKGLDLSAHFAHAFTQILEWKTYYDNNKKAIEDTYGVVGPHGEATPPTFVLIMGRRSQLDDSVKAEWSRLESLFNRVRLMTYDRLLQAAPLAITIAEGYRRANRVS
jgi:hypothetical protein